MTRKSFAFVVALGIAAATGASASAEDAAGKIGGALTDGYEGLRDGMLDSYETARKGTVEKWNDITGNASSTTQGPPSALVAGVQRELIAAGYSPGPTDGRYGPLTGTAIRAYQTDNSLAQDGQVSQTLLDGMQKKRTTATRG